jgi:hypothetical protein
MDLPKDFAWRIQGANRTLTPSPQRLTPVKESTLYPEQFPILLRERMQGMTITDAADALEIPVEQFERTHLLYQTPPDTSTH